MVHRTPRQILQLIKQRKIQFVDLRFTDFPGLPQHCTYPASELNDRAFTHGIGFDGSSVRGWEGLNETDMLLVPLADTAVIDPFFDRPTLAMCCDIRDPVTKREYSRDPRSVARKCEAWLRKTGIADEARFGPEAEFFVFDSVRYEQTVNEASYRVDSVEGIWNRGQESEHNKGNQIRLAKAISRRPRSTPSPTSATKSSAPSSPSASMSKAITTKSPPAANAKSTSATTPSSEWPTSSSTTNMPPSRPPPATARSPPSCPSPSSWTTAPACTSTSHSSKTASPSSPEKNMPASPKPPSTPSAASLNTAHPSAPSAPDH